MTPAWALLKSGKHRHRPPSRHQDVDMQHPAPSNALHLELDAEEHFDVREFSLEDGLSSLTSIDIVAVSPNPAVDFEQIVGKNAAFSIQVGAHVYGGAPAPRWTGLISEIHQIRSEDTGLSTYHLTLVPKLWLLTRRSNCRVFQQMSDLDVARALLAEWGIEATIEVSRPGKTRKYRVQYQETDYAFFCRLLEAAGITHFHRRTDEGSRLVLTDAPERGEKRRAPLAHTNEPLGRDRLFATAFRASRMVRSGRVTFADHDHRLANKPLLAHAQTSQLPFEANLEHFSYTPGSFRFGTKGTKDTPFADDRGRTRTDPDEAQRIADQAAASAVARTRRFAFESNALDLSPGSVLRMVDHPLADREGELLLTHVSLSGSFDGEPRVSCRAVSARLPYAPDALTPSPSIFGVESATVVGPAGETIHCDEFGRVRVQFHWDRYGQMNEQSSCWVPVVQAWAGDALGSLNLPRVGQEVIVSFLGGNPEEPVIVGRIFTNLLRPPFPLPQNKTQNGFRSASVPATGGYNELMFEDKAGAELLRMRAERDMATRVNHDQSLSVGRHRSAAIEGNDKEQVTGEQRHSVGQNMVSSVIKNQIATVGGTLVSMAGGDRIHETTGGAVSNANTHQITSLVGTTIQVGASMIHIGPDAIVIQSPLVLLNPGEDVAASMALGGAAPTPGA
jgi:type VI secretion system secreted protein VgrG